MCSMERNDATILHADLDSFFASVHQRDDPALRGRPVAVGGGVVLAASYEAKAHGVRTAMPGRQARQACPGLVVVEPRFDAYVEASKAVFSVFDATSPLVEGISIDEAFLDVGGLGRSVGPPLTIARSLRRRVADEVGLPITVGIARTKFLAKVASAAAKPDGLLLVPPAEEADFLHPLPIERLWGVGPRTSERLRGRGYRCVGDLAAVEEGHLAAIVGAAAAHHLHALARLEDPRRVQVGVRRRSIGAQRALGRGRWTPAEVDAALIGLVDRVTRRLRAADRVCRTVVLRLRFDDLSRATRSHTLAEPTADTAVVLAATRSLRRAAGEAIAERGLTLVGVALTGLAPIDAVQLALPFDGHGPELDGAVDRVRARFGTSALTRAVLLRRGEGIEMPTLAP